MLVTKVITTRPAHKKYAFAPLSNATYYDYANRYSACKRYGFRGVVAFTTGTGVYGIVKEVVKGTLIQYGKRRLAVLVISGATYVCAPAVAVLTNATRVVRTCKVIHTTIGYTVEALEDIGTLIFLPIDLALFGQPIPTGKPNRYSNWGLRDIINDIPDIGDNG